MKINFVKSAVNPADYPEQVRPEVVIAGRSNAGKSSFINALAGGARVALVSSTPGKTRLLNFFDAGKYYRIVDTPGYGYAARSGGEVIAWQKMLTTYFSVRAGVAGLILIMDVRRDWSPDEELLVNWMRGLALEVILVLTKADKLGRGAGNKRMAEIKRQANLSNVYLVSVLKKQGIDEVEQDIFARLIKSKFK